MGGRDLETVLLLPHRMNMKLSRNSSNQEPVDLPLFNIISWELTQRNMDCPKEGLRMIVVLRRKPWREVFTTYLPTILLIMTTYLTTFFKHQFFEAALGANLTTMLMMTTIFMTNLSELTDTAYAKWLDVWLIFSQLVPFIEVVLLTLQESYRQKHEDKGMKQKKKRRKIKIQTLAINVIQPLEDDANTTIPQESATKTMCKKVLEFIAQKRRMPTFNLFNVLLIGKIQILYFFLTRLITS